MRDSPHHCTSRRDRKQWNWDELETIGPFRPAPWQEAIQVCILDQDKAQKWTGTPHEVKLFTDAWYRNDNAGIGLFYSIENEKTVMAKDKWAIARGQSEGLTVTYIEILAIQQALHRIADLWFPRQSDDWAALPVS